MLSNRSRGTLMSYIDQSARCRFKSNTPWWICCFVSVLTGSTETPSKLFANHNALGQLTNHNTFSFSEGGPSSNLELMKVKWKWSDMWPSMVTHTRNLCSAINPSKLHIHSSEHTHTVNTHPEQIELFVPVYMWRMLTVTRWMTGQFTGCM